MLVFLTHGETVIYTRNCESQHFEHTPNSQQADPKYSERLHMRPFERCTHLEYCTTLSLVLLLGCRRPTLPVLGIAR